MKFSILAIFQFDCEKQWKSLSNKINRIQAKYAVNSIAYMNDVNAYKMKWNPTFVLSIITLND